MPGHNCASVARIYNGVSHADHVTVRIVDSESESIDMDF